VSGDCLFAVSRFDAGLVGLEGAGQQRRDLFFNAQEERVPLI